MPPPIAMSSASSNWPPDLFSDRNVKPTRKPKPLPQFELPQAEAVFNLASETATDGDRRRREAEARAEGARAAAQQQPELL
jgi:hypothetical protein